MKNFALDIWQDLREKRLWPVAVALAVALAAVPALLLKGAPENSSSGPGAVASTGAQLPVMGVDSTGMAGSSTLDSFRSKDPFRSDADPAKASSALGAAGSVPGGATAAAGADTDLGTGASGSTGTGALGNPSGAGSSGSSGGSASPGGGSPAGGDQPSGGGPSSPDPAPGGGSGGGSASPPTSEPPAPRYYTYAADVSFGLPGNERRFRDLEAVAPLVGRRGAVVAVYLGQSPEGDSVFLVNQEFEVTEGRSNCRSQCAFVNLRAEKGRSKVELRGEDGATYRLTLHGVRRVLDERESSSQSTSQRSKRAKAAARESSQRARRTHFDFRIPLIAGRRR